MKKSLFISLAVLAAALCARAEIPADDLLNESKLIGLLQKAETSDNDRVTACQNLGWCGTKAAVGPLAALLSNEKPVLRHAARYGLEMIPDPAVEEALCEAAGSLTGPALAGVLQSMGNLKPAQSRRSVWAVLVGGGRYARSVAILRSRMSDSDKAIAAAAVQSLGKLATPEALAALKSGLGTCPCVAVAYLNGAGKVADADQAQAAAYYADIRRAKENVSPATRLAALRGEIVTAGKDGVRLFGDAIASADADTVDAALRAALDLPKSDEATAAFAAALAKAPAVQARLATVLGQRGDPAAGPALADLAKGGNAECSLAAAAALAALNDPAAIPPLLALSKHADAAIADAAKNEIMGFAGKPADDAVLALMADAEAATRLAGIDMAMRRRMAAAVPSLVKLTADADEKILDAAVRGLGELGTDQEIPALLAAIAKAPQSETAVRALSSLCTRYARPRGGKTVIKSALYGSFENDLFKDVTANVQKLVDVGSITIQASGRLCKWDGFSEDPAPGKPKALRMVYTFDGTEKSVQVRENDSVHLSGETLLPAAMDPIRKAYEAAKGLEKLALFKVLTSLANDQGLAVARAAASQTADADVREAAIRALAEWKSPDALDDAAAFAQRAPTDRLKILALRGFVRQLELSFTIPMDKQIARLEQAQAWATRDEDKAFLAAALAVTRRQLAEKGFQPMFDGTSLKQWKGGGGWWQVKDGILQAQSSEEKPCTKNSHLIWTGGQPGDFELRAEFRLSPSANSGIQIRSKEEEFGDSGYQADMNGGGDYVGFLYHPKQHLVGERGAKVVIDAKGQKSVERFAESKALQEKVFKGDDWNEYTVICKGPSITLFVNGMKTCEFEDHRADAPRKGFITLQMHAGPPMKIQYRNLRIKELK
jgi:HEAT repeat protein